jgi:lysophospholipase L1-like esterase
VKRVAARLALAASAAVLALASAELAWRVLRTADFGPTTNPRYVVRDERLGWRYQSNALVRHATAEFDVAIRINAAGFRDATPATAADRPIVMLGDSLTFGWGVEERDAFPALLEQATGIPVANLGVSGYGTDQELLLFAQAGAALAPRAVVLVVCANDVEEVSRRSMYGRAKPFFRFAAEAGGAPEAWDLDARLEPPAGEPFLVRVSQIARSIAKARSERAREPLEPNELEAGRDHVAELLARLAAESHAGGAQLLVCGFDVPWLAARLAPRGLAYLDLSAALAHASADGPVRFGVDAHWTALGHRAAAAAIAARLAEDRALD